MAHNAMQFVLDMVQGAADLVASEPVDVVFPDGGTYPGVYMLHPVESSTAELEGGLMVEAKVRAFTVDIEKIGNREPVRDMLLTWRGQTFKASHPGGGKVWEWQDHEQSRVVITTRQVPATASPGSGYINADGSGYGSGGAGGEQYGRP